MFKSYDGWQVVGEQGARAVLAKFTKEDGEVVHYGSGAIRQMAKKPSASMDASDRRLIQAAANDGPRLIHSFGGWRDLGDKNGSVMVAFFNTSTSRRGPRYNLSALHNWAASPPKKATAFDREMVNLAMQDAPKARR